MTACRSRRRLNPAVISRTRRVFQRQSATLWRHRRPVLPRRVPAQDTSRPFQLVGRSVHIRVDRSADEDGDRLTGSSARLSGRECRPGCSWRLQQSDFSWLVNCISSARNSKIEPETSLGIVGLYLRSINTHSARILLIAVEHDLLANTFLHFSQLFYGALIRDFHVR